MAKMREYKFFKDDADETPIETLDRTSWKTAVKSIQNKIKDKRVIIEYISKQKENELFALYSTSHLSIVKNNALIEYK